MATQRIGAQAAAAVPLPLGTETALAVLTVRGTQDSAAAGILIRGEAVVTGAASATTCTLTWRYGNGTGGNLVPGGSQAFSVDGAATQRTLVLSVIDTTGQAGATQYTLTGTAAGAAQTAAATVLETQELEATF